MTDRPIILDKKLAEIAHVAEVKDLIHMVFVKNEKMTLWNKIIWLINFSIGMVANISSLNFSSSLAKLENEKLHQIT